VGGGAAGRWGGGPAPATRGARDLPRMALRADRQRPAPARAHLPFSTFGA
jgi:hypothetical protein